MIAKTTKMFWDYKMPRQWTLFTMSAIFATHWDWWDKSNVTWYFGDKQVIKLANTTNRGRVYLFFQNEKTFILVLQNVQFEFLQVLHYYGLLSEHLRCLYHIQKGNNKHFHPKFSIIVFLIKKLLRFLFSRVNKVVRDFVYWSQQKIP